VRDTGGAVVFLNWIMKHLFNIHEKDVLFACSDIGWIVGHSYTVYGTLIRGATSIFFEGKPVLPDAGVLWRLVEQHKVKSIIMAPTAVRAIKKVDYEGSFVKTSDVSCLEGFHLLGERCDPATVLWIHKQFPHCIINDTWGQTETGGALSGTYLNRDIFKHVFPTLPGSTGKPLPGYQIKILNDDG
jgi:propionyl-CoA synthetase